MDKKKQGVQFDCRKCKGTGVIENEVQTNEEWFCQLPTEEKAKFLFEHGVIVCNFCKGDCVEIDYKTSECKYNVSPSYSYTGIVEWLKQPHTPQKQDDYPCNVKGCSLETRQACCGCPDYFEWEKQHKE